MSYLLEDEQIEIVKKALSLLRDVHFGKLETISQICKTNEEFLPSELKSHLADTSRFITGKSFDEKLSFDAAHPEARLSQDIIDFIVKQSCAEI